MSTLKEIAGHLGVGVSTVSYVLRGKAEAQGISAALAKRIHATAERLNYRPNVAAQTMRQGRFGTVALVIGARWALGHLPGPLLGAIEDGLEERDLRMLISRFPDAQLTDQGFVPRILRELSSDGLLIAYNEQVPPAMVALIRRHRLPAVWIDAALGHDCVIADDLGAGRQAAEHLLALGHRRIAYSHYFWSNADPAIGHHSVADRRRGCEEAVRAAGARLVPGALRDAVADSAAHFAAARRCLGAADRPTAVVGYSGEDGEAFFTAASQLGLRVPQDLSIVVCSDAQRLILDRPWTTSLIPLVEMGREAVAMLHQRLADPERPLAARVVPHRFLAGATTSPPNEPSEMPLPRR